MLKATQLVHPAVSSVRRVFGTSSAVEAAPERLQTRACYGRGLLIFGPGSAHASVSVLGPYRRLPFGLAAAQRQEPSEPHPRAGRWKLVGAVKWHRSQKSDRRQQFNHSLEDATVCGPERASTKLSRPLVNVLERSLIALHSMPWSQDPTGCSEVDTLRSRVLLCGLDSPSKELLGPPVRQLERSLVAYPPSTPFTCGIRRVIARSIFCARGRCYAAWTRRRKSY